MGEMSPYLWGMRLHSTVVVDAKGAIARNEDAKDDKDGGEDEAWDRGICRKRDRGDRDQRRSACADETEAVKKVVIGRLGSEIAVV